jgi:hypothetical protein
MRHTVSGKGEIERIADAKVDDAEKALILLFEFLLIKDLYSNDG